MNMCRAGVTNKTRGFIRGGNWNNGSNAGAFALNLNNTPTNTNTNIGFRVARSRKLQLRGNHEVQEYRHVLRPPAVCITKKFSSLHLSWPMSAAEYVPAARSYHRVASRRSGLYWVVNGDYISNGGSWRNQAYG